MQLRKNAKVDLLKRVPLFAGCSKADVQRIAEIADELDLSDPEVSDALEAERALRLQSLDALAAGSAEEPLQGADRVGSDDRATSWWNGERPSTRPGVHWRHANASACTCASWRTSRTPKSPSGSGCR